ncbi:uncharacterized protein [Anabrus simplex]|uniref:uncharacterized protein isoform X2 n=1 Tax=Anabrus simplex TaxID=316456 RepID=UPI0035A373CC
MKGNSENMSSAVWRPKIATVQITERTGPRAPFENNSGKKVYSKVTIPAGGTSCFDVDLNIGSEVKILHDRRTKKLVGGYCLFICVYSALIYGLTTFQLESTLTITNHRVNLLQQEMRWMASNYRQMKQKMLSMKLSLDELLKKHRYDESLNSEESPTIPQFIGTDGELLSQSAPNMLSSNEINSDVIERIQATKSNEDNVPVVSGTSDQSGFMSSHNLILREYDEIVNNHLKNNKSVSVSDNVTSFQNVFNQSELQSGVPFVDNIISLDTFSDYESVPVEDFDQDKEDSTGQSSRVKRSNRRGPVAAHFKGGQIETVIRDGGSMYDSHSVLLLKLLTFN